MNASEWKSGLLAPTGMGEWSLDDIDGFEAARGLLDALISAYSARIAAAEGEAAMQLRVEQQTCVTERRTLSVRDTETVERIRREYPARLRTVRGEVV
ncbi:hypothetical protein ACFVZW_19370 [Streptomyces sp. NPDC059567]|uniref:hypothetical protein n=1 Tax=Streptomyces sp. NPDC059567 TaxID=3346867 RepID=UPI0036CB59BC